MGSFFTNLQIRNASTAAVCEVLPKLVEARAYVSPECRGWVTVYCEATEDQDDKTMRVLAGGLSKALKTDALGFLVHDSDIAMYWLYRDGVLTDEFNSAPDYFGERVSEQIRARFRGSADALLPLCVKDTLRAQLDAVLHPPDGPPTFADETVADLAKLLGIDETRATLGFNYFAEEGADILPDIAAFEPVGKGAERKEANDETPIYSPGGAFPSDPAPDDYPIAVGMLTQVWNPKFSEKNLQFSKWIGNQAEDLMKQMHDAFDKSARRLIKKSKLPGLPTIEELIAARNQGPEFLAELIGRKTPAQLAEIGVGALEYKIDAFVAALLKHGLDPTAPNAQGQTTLDVAERQGKDRAIYWFVKAAAERK